MPFAGEEVAAPDIYKFADDADASADLTLSTTFTDVTGATVTFTTPADDCTVLIVGTAYCSCDSFISGVLIQARAVVDGTAQAGTINYLATSAISRVSASRSWVATLASAGSHTIKLQGAKSASSGTYQILGTNTGISVLAFKG